MEIIYTKSFWKNYQKLSEKQQIIVDKTIMLFEKNPHEKSLYNHPLKGKFKGYREFHVSGDLCIVFEEIDNYIKVIFLRVGSHNQLRIG